MSLRLDLEAAIKNLKITLENLDSDIQRFEGLIKDHFDLDHEVPEPGRKVPAQVFSNLEKEINDIKADVKVLTK